MHKLSIFLSILVLTSVVVSCSQAKTPEDYRMPTDIPTAPELTATVQAEIAASIPASDCPLTVPQEPAFVPPSPYDTLNSFKDHFWFGSNSLWTIIPMNGVWDKLPYNGSSGYTQKVVWWHDGYRWNEEPEPNLVVTGERLDDKSPPLKASHANGAYASDIGSAMMVGVDIPTAGCWKITGKYNDTELNFVIWVAPQ